MKLLNAGHPKRVVVLQFRNAGQSLCYGSVVGLYCVRERLSWLVGEGSLITAAYLEITDAQVNRLIEIAVIRFTSTLDVELAVAERRPRQIGVAESHQRAS
jgi:hypothetical protein